MRFWRSPVAQYSGWVHEGRLIEVPGNTIDYQQIEDQIVVVWCDTLNVQQVCFDRALAAHMLQSLQKRFERKMGRDAAERFLVIVNQNLETMNPAMQELERAVLDGDFQHPDDPAQTWSVSNVVVQRNFKDEIYPCGRQAGKIHRTRSTRPLGH